MKKAYLPCKIEIFTVCNEDVITTSSDVENVGVDGDVDIFGSIF